jgi:hypothetical protein
MVLLAMIIFTMIFMAMQIQPMKAIDPPYPGTVVRLPTATTCPYKWCGAPTPTVSWTNQ